MSGTYTAHYGLWSVEYEAVIDTVGVEATSTATVPIKTWSVPSCCEKSERTFELETSSRPLDLTLDFFSFGAGMMSVERPAMFRRFRRSPSLVPS